MHGMNRPSGQMGQTNGQMGPQTAGQMMPQMTGQMMPQMAGQMMPQTAGQMMPQMAGQMMPQMAGKMMGQMMPQMVPPGLSGQTILPQMVSPEMMFMGVVPTGARADEQTYVENILRMNRGKVATVYTTNENNPEWAARVFTGRVENAARDHVVLSDPQSGRRFIVFMVNIDYITFDEPLQYDPAVYRGRP